MVTISILQVADELLHRKVDVESCYIAAQTMRTKIQHSFHELPPESHTSLRDSLLEHVNAVTEDTNSVIVTQLCLAIADLALLMGPQGWPQAVADLTTRYTNKYGKITGSPTILLFVRPLHSNNFNFTQASWLGKNMGSAGNIDCPS